MYNRLYKYRRVTDGRTDRQTDGQTSCHGIVRAMHTRRAVKTENHFPVTARSEASAMQQLTDVMVF